MSSSRFPAARPAAQYDSFADIYGVWTETAPTVRSNRRLYVEAYLAAGGPVVELGVGDGRITVEQRCAGAGWPGPMSHTGATERLPADLRTTEGTEAPTHRRTPTHRCGDTVMR